MYDAEASFADFIEYGKAYFIEGLRHPDTYFNAWFDLTSGYLIPSSNMVVYETTGSVVEGESPLVWQPDELDGLRSLMLDAYHLASSIPGVNVIFLIAIYALWVPLICGVILAKKAPNYFPILIPFLVSFASCLITPAIHTRYALPLIYTAPILLAVTYSLCRNKDSKPP